MENGDFSHFDMKSFSFFGLPSHLYISHAVWSVHSRAQSNRDSYEDRSTGTEHQGAAERRCKEPVGGKSSSLAVVLLLAPLKSCACLFPL